MNYVPRDTAGAFGFTGRSGSIDAIGLRLQKKKDHGEQRRDNARHGRDLSRIVDLFIRRPQVDNLNFVTLIAGKMSAAARYSPE